MRILIIPFLLAASLPAFAEVDPKIHKLCIEAKDYSGCVRSMKGETSTETTVNQIQRQGANLTEGNMCPAQHLSSGGGYCQRVICVKRGIYGRGHAEGLGGKGNTCKGGAELTWDNNHQPMRASLDKRCPPGDLDIGFQSTCNQALARGYFEAYSLGFTTHKLGVTRSALTLTDSITKIYGSPAKEKLKIGDKILSINGKSYSEYKPNFHAPATYQLIVERLGETLEFSLVTEFQKVDYPKAKNL